MLRNIYIQASFCRTKLNRVTERSLYTALMEMRRLDVARDSVLRPGVIDEVIRGHGLPLGPCLPHLHQRFRDNRFRQSTNYERLMTYLEVSRSFILFNHCYQYENKPEPKFSIKS